MEHKFALDDILFSANALCILDNGLPGCLVGVDEIGDVSAGTFEEDFLLDNLLIICK